MPSLRKRRPSTLAGFFGDEHDHMARLVYIDESQLEDVKLRATAKASKYKRAVKVHVNESDLSVLRTLRAGDCCIVTKRNLMRGYDYRC